jgi:hypothetical protein
MLTLLLLCGSLSKPVIEPRIITIIKLDHENLLVLSKQPIDTVYIDDMYQNTDYMLEQDPQNQRVVIRMLTARGPLKVIVETVIPGTKGLRRKHCTTVINPASPR